MTCLTVEAGIEMRLVAEVDEVWLAVHPVPGDGFFTLQ
jgi:hypothetical protein